MGEDKGIEITNRDRLLRAWQNSTELARDFQSYSDEIKDNKEYKKLFAEFAEEEAIHASKFHEILHKFE